MEIIYSIQKPGESDYKELLAHLEAMDEYYTTRLSTRVDLESYAQKLYQRLMCSPQGTMLSLLVLLRSILIFPHCILFVRMCQFCLNIRELKE